MPPEGAVMAVAEHLCAQPAAGGDAEAVRSCVAVVLLLGERGVQGRAAALGQRGGSAVWRTAV